MKFLSVCSGIEAVSEAMKPLGFSPLVLAEIEDFPREVLKVRHGAEDARFVRAGIGPLLWGDMASIKRRFLARCGVDLADVDMLVGGTPCQAFSVAGLRQSLADDRGNLTLVFVRLANAIDNLRRARGRPPVTILWENVPGVLNVPDNAFGCFLGALAGSDAPLVPPKGCVWTDAGVVAGPKRCAAWRCLDAQHFGLAQRRKRVFVLARGGADAWACADALLPILESMQWHSAPSREARKDVTGTLGSRSSAGGGLGTDFDLGGGGSSLRDGAFGGNRTSGGIDVAAALNAKGVGRMDFETETLVAFSSKDSGLDAGEIAPTLRAMGHSKSHANAGGQLAIAHALTAARGRSSSHDPSMETFVAHTLRGGGFDASEDGTGRGTPLVPVLAPTLRAGGNATGGDRPPGTDVDTVESLIPVLGAIPLRASGAANSNGSGIGEAGDPALTLDCDGSMAVAFAENSRAEIRLEGGDGQTVSALKTGGGKPGQSYPAIAFHGRQDPDVAGDKTHPLDTDGHSDAVAVGDATPVMTVRRLTPEECEKLQGFRPGYTAINVRGKPAADGPRYRALGNSMAVPVMRWLGSQIKERT